MPPRLIADPSSIRCDQPVFTREQIYQVLPQQFEFSQLDGIVLADKEAMVFAAYRDVRPDEWWCRGHMPQQAIFPGVLMIEAAAQLSAFSQQLLVPMPGTIMGFGGVDGAKFRDSIYPPARIILIGRPTDTRQRRFRSEVQGFVDGKMAFEAEISGIRLKI